MTKTVKIKLAFQNYFKALNELKSLCVTKNKKDFTSQLGEWLVETLYDGKRSENGIEKYWDIECYLGKVQVKTHALYGARALYFYGTNIIFDHGAAPTTRQRGGGLSVRCIKN